MKYILAIDQGTTGSRAICYDKKGCQIASAYEEFPQVFPQPGWVEHNPNEMWLSVNHSIQKVLAKVDPHAIEAIGITNQRETTLLWDRDTGKPVHNAIVWQCRRTAQRCEQLKKDNKTVSLIRGRTGLPVDAYFSGTKLEWLFNQVPGARKKALDGKLAFGTPDSWVLWKLTGGTVHATDYTNASRTMLFNITELKWDSAICKKLNIIKKVLPQVQPSASIFGKTCKIGRLPAGIPITGIAGDQQAALFGQTCFSPGTMKNTYGTGSFLLVNTGKKRCVSRHGLITTIGCDMKGEPIYVLEGAIFITGAAMQWIRDGLSLLKDARESEQMASSIPDTGGVYFVPAFVGLGAPYWDQDARGLISGITRGTTRAHIVRAALEAMCYQTRDVVKAMERDTGMTVKNLRIDGGAVANNFLCQFQADILGIPVIRPKVIETTALGAAYLAGLQVGYWKNADEIRKCWAQDKIFTPCMKKKDADRLYDGWKTAVVRTCMKK